MPGLSEYAALSFAPKGQQALILANAVERYEHQHGQRLAQFEYLKRDGAEQEPMGASASRLTYKLVLMGSAPLTSGGASLSAGERYAQLLKIARGQPKGLLVDIRLGRWNVGLASIRASEDPKKAIDTIELTIEFVEDQIDQGLAIEQQPSPQVRANQAVSAYSILVAASAIGFGESPLSVMQGAHQAAVRFGEKVAAYTNAAVESSGNIAIDPSLRVQIKDVRDSQEEYFAALDRTLSQTLEPPVSLAPYRHATYMALSACEELQISIDNLKPQVIEYVLPKADNLLSVLVRIYGNEAQEHFDEALLLNPFVNPVLISQGTTLSLVSPVPKQ